MEPILYPHMDESEDLRLYIEVSLRDDFFELIKDT